MKKKAVLVQKRPKWIMYPDMYRTIITQIFSLKEIDNDICDNQFELGDPNNLFTIGFHANGALKRTYYESDGFCYKWHNNGQLEEKYEKINGKIEGEYNQWWDNGNLKISTNYKDDKMDGDFNEWWLPGHLCRKCHFDDGKRNGLYQEFSLGSGIMGGTAGLIKCECTFIDGKMNGRYRDWYKGTRDLAVDCIYKNGKLVRNSFKHYAPVDGTGLNQIVTPEPLLSSWIDSYKNQPRI
jgi:hypothetical protein